MPMLKKDNKEPEIKYTDNPNRLALQRILFRLRFVRLVVYATIPFHCPFCTKIRELFGVVLLVCFIIAIFAILKLILLP